MLNKDGNRELAYLVEVTDVEQMNADRLEAVCINGWRCVCGKGIFHKGDIAIFFEIDSKLPEVEPFIQNEFLKNKKFKIKSQKIRGVVSQGLLMHPDEFGWKIEHGFDCDLGREVYYVNDGEENHFLDEENRFLTEKLGVTYAVVEDNVRKAPSGDKYKKMAQRHPKLARTWWWKLLCKNKVGKKILFAFFGKKRESNTSWPVGKFPGVAKTDQERCENMPWVLNDKTPFIRTQKCDGSSATYILYRKRKNKYEFYVCSRNVRMLNENQKSFYDENYYWQCAKKYDIENKMKRFLIEHPDVTFVCWQGEICGPGIQKNPQGLSELHLFCFHMTDSTVGRYDIRIAANIWKQYNMETVPIELEPYVLPDDFEEFKLSADGFYDPSCCEGKTTQRREGFVYYKTTDPTFSFKNVSREYLLKL